MDFIRPTSVREGQGPVRGILASSRRQSPSAASRLGLRTSAEGIGQYDHGFTGGLNNGFAGAYDSGYAGRYGYGGCNGHPYPYYGY